MTILSSDIVPLQAIDIIYRPHLNTVMTHNGTDYTSTAQIHKLFKDKAKIKLLREEASNRRLERLRHSDTNDGDSDPHRLDGVGKKYDVGY